EWSRRTPAQRTGKRGQEERHVPGICAHHPDHALVPGEGVHSGDRRAAAREEAEAVQLSAQLQGPAQGVELDPCPSGSVFAATDASLLNHNNREMYHEESVYHRS